MCTHFFFLLEAEVGKRCLEGGFLKVGFAKEGSSKNLERGIARMILYICIRCNVVVGFAESKRLLICVILRC
jgi:hypothetical protein